MLLCIRINREHELALTELPDFVIMEPFFDEMNMILWPKFQSILDEHIASMKRAKSKGLHYSPLLPASVVPDLAHAMALYSMHACVHVCMYT